MQANYPAPGVPQAQHASPGHVPQTHAAGQAAGEINFHDPTGKYKLVLENTFAAVEARVTKADRFKAEGGAMISMSQNVALSVAFDGGVGTACLRSCCASESACITFFDLKPESTAASGDVLLSPSVPGDIIMLHMDGSTEWLIQKGSYFCSDESIHIGVHLQGPVRGCCGGEGFFILKASGAGRLLINSYGSMIRYDLQPGEKRKIDNGFLVAWPKDMQCSIGFASSSILESILSGEGLVCEFTGPGTIYAQTRAIEMLANTLYAYYNGGGAGGV